MTLLKLYENYVEKLVKCLPMDDAHFITKLSANQLLPGDTENKIKSLQTQSDKALYFLNHVIKPALDIGIFSGFKKLLSIMHNCGYDHVQELSCKIEQDMNEPIKPVSENTSTIEHHSAPQDVFPESDHVSVHSTPPANDFGDLEMNVDFSTYKDVANAFAELFTICQRAIKFSTEEFRTIRNSCVARASEPLRGLIKRATDNHCLFETLAENNRYCNWMDVRLLKVIAIACGNKQLQMLIENYTDVIYSKTLHEIWDYIPHYTTVRDQYYSELKATFEKDPDNMTVKELLKCKPQLAKKIAVFIAVIQWESLLVTWLIPTDEVYQAYLSFLTVPQQSRKDELIQFGTWKSYPPRYVLQNYAIDISCGAVSVATLLIGYYHGLLLRDIDADHLTDKMCSTGLLTHDEISLISSGHTVHHRNWLLLEHVRKFKPQCLLQFCKLIKEEWVGIGSQLIAVLEFSLSKMQSTTAVLSSCQCESRSTANVSTVLVLYFYLIDQLEELLQSYDYGVMMEQCRSLMASDHDNIKLFTSDQIKSFSWYGNAMLLRKLCAFAWSNHSILRTLVNNCSEAIKLLDKFESNLDPLKPVSCYPIPCLSSNMIPSDASTYTILAVRCKKELYESSLQYVYDVQSVMIEKCDLTQHCLRLLAVRRDPTILYWTIPKCVVDLINTNVPLHSEHLYSRGILEVLVYPKILLTTGDNVCYGSLAFECVDTEKTYQQELDEVKLENKMLQEKTSELQSRQHTANKQVNTKYQELKDKEQHNTPAKDDLQTDDKSAMKRSDSESLPAPTNIKATVLTPNSVEVTWDQLSDVTGYLISCTSPASYAGGKNVIVNGGDNTRYILIKLVENTPYDITVQGLTGDDRKGLCSEKVSVKTSTTAPSSPPRDINVLSDDPASLIVSWQPPLEGDGNGTITGYVIQYTRVGNFESDDKMILNVPNTTMFVISGLIACVEYKVSVAAVNKNGTGPFSKPELAISGEDTPSEPCSLKLATVTSTSVTLKWMPPKYPNGIILKYSIEYDGKSIEKFGDEVSDQMTGTIEGLSPYTVYILDMKANTGVGAGPPACFTWKTRLPAPTNVQATVLTPNSVEVTWDHLPEATGYLISCTSPASYAGEKNVIASGGDTIRHTLTDVVENTPYDITVQGISKDGRQSDPSNEVSITTQKTAPSSPPEDINVESKDPAMLIVSWQPPLKKNCNGQITGYVMQYARMGQHTDNMIVNVSSVTTFAISGLHANVEYSVTVAAVNDKGTGPFSKPIVATSGENTPSEPQQLEIDSVSSTSVTLQWMPPKYPNGIITQYSVHYDGKDIEKFGNIPDKLIDTIEGLSPNSVYVLKMKAHTRMGSGPPVSLAVQTRLPAPTNVKATVLTPNSVEVTWDQLSDVTGYLISCTSPVSYAGNKNVPTKGGDATSYTLIKLVENTPYNITVQGVTRDGRKSDQSTEVSIKTQKDAPSSPPENIEVLTADAASLQVSWQPPQDNHCNGQITGYVIQYARVGSDDKMIMNVPNVTELIISGLFACARYSVTVAAVNVNGTGPFSISVVATSGEDTNTNLTTFATDKAAHKIFCSKAQKKLQKNHKELSSLPYEKMSKILLAKQVFTNQEKSEIAQAELIGISKMEQVLDIVIKSLKCNEITKYKAFIEAMEESSDVTLQKKAKELDIEEED